MIPKADFYAFLIIAFIYALWLAEQVRQIKEEVKALRKNTNQK